jgi:hypothetical protein
VNEYLQKLHDLRAKKRIPYPPSKLTKPQNTPEHRGNGGSVSLGGDQGRSIFEPELWEKRIPNTRFDSIFPALQSCCPGHVPVARWQLAVDDGRAFLTRWGDQAEALGWTARDLFGLIAVPEHAKPSFNRLSRYDEIGLIWLLCGRRVVALTEASAAIQNPTGAITIYPRHNKPALGPVGDSLDDFK